MLERNLSPSPPPPPARAGRDVARWAFDVLYSRDENFGAWLESLGFDVLYSRDEDEGL